MTNQELLHDLNRRQLRIETAVSALRSDLRELEARIGTETAPVVSPLPLPPLPPPFPEMGFQSVAAPRRDVAPILPEVPVLPVTPKLAEEPVRTEEEVPVVTPAAESTPEEKPGFELQFGRWLARIGVVFALFTLIFFGALVKERYYQYLGPWSKLSVLTLVSGGLIAAGLRLESRDKKLLVYGRTLAGGGLACLYYTIYGATYVPQLEVISSKLFGGFLLLAWSAVVLTMAERRKSELLSVFAISLAYFSSAITPGNAPMMAADLLLALTAVLFLVRNAWSGLSFLCLVGTYAGFLRQAVTYVGPLDFQWTGSLPFGSSAVYLTGGWVIFTGGILFSRSTHFAETKRMAFLCLNNGAWAGLLVVAAWLGSFHHLGGILGAVGAAFLGAYALTRVMRPEARDVLGAYLAQGLLFATGGIVVATTGVTRGLMITMESVFLVAAGAFSRNLILRIGGGLSALLGAAYLANEIGLGNHHPWVLTFGGAAAMLANAWLARREFWSEPVEQANDRFVLSSALYVLLGLALLATGVVAHAPENWIAPDLAIIALALTLAVYVVPVFELAPLSQILLVLAQAIAFLPALGGTPATQGLNFGSAPAPNWSLNLVAAVTMLLTTWWPRQKRVRTLGWFTPLSVLYALAMVAYCYDAMQPQVSAPTWMISAALISLLFLAYGAWSRLWAFLVSGQILLALSVATLLHFDDPFTFPWTWWAAAVPIATVFGTGWILGLLLPRYVAVDESTHSFLRIVARVYQGLALALLIRWVFGVAPTAEITLALLALGTAFVFGGSRLGSSYGVRSGFVLSVAGVAHYLAAMVGANQLPFTWMDAGAFLLFLSQPALLRLWARELISREESWAVIGLSAAMGWLFVSNSVAAVQPNNLTLGWALFALALTVIGFVVNERRQRWCGLAILAAAFVRVAVHDFWQFSDLYKVLTFLALTVICLGLSFLYYKFADKLKEWL